MSTCARRVLLPSGLTRRGRRECLGVGASGRAAAGARGPRRHVRAASLTSGRRRHCRRRHPRGLGRRHCRAGGRGSGHGHRPAGPGPHRCRHHLAGPAGRPAQRRGGRHGVSGGVVRAGLLDCLPSARPALQSICGNGFTVHSGDAARGTGRRPVAAARRVGGHGPVLLPSDRPRQRTRGRSSRRGQGIPHDPRRRRRLRAGHRGTAGRRPHDQHLGAVAARDARLVVGYDAHGRSAAPDRRGGGQVGAVPVAHLAARRDGGPDPHLGADPCRNHGRRWRLRAGPLAAAGRQRPSRASGVGRRGVHLDAGGGPGGPGPERPQAGAGLVDDQPGRLPSRRARGQPDRARVGALGAAPALARRFQGTAVPRRRGARTSAAHDRPGRPGRRLAAFSAGRADLHRGTGLARRAAAAVGVLVERGSPRCSRADRRRRGRPRLGRLVGAGDGAGHRPGHRGLRHPHLAAGRPCAPKRGHRVGTSRVGASRAAAG